MGRKKEYILLIVLIIGLGVFIWKDKTDQMHYQLPTLQELSPAEVTKVQLGQDEKSATLLQTDDQTWVLEQDNFPANTAQVEKILQAVADLSLSAMVSESEQYARYDLTEPKVIEVKAWSEGELKRHFFVGKAASTYQNSYIRMDGDPAVYMAQSNLRLPLNQDASSLRDKTVLTFSPKDITRITLTTPKESVHLSMQEMDKDFAAQNGTRPKPEPVWQKATGQEMDTAQVNALLDHLSGLKCARYLLDTSGKDLGPASMHILLQGEKAHDLKIYSQALSSEEGTAATSSKRSYPFVLSAYNGKQILKKCKPFLSETAPTDPPDSQE